ncbi:hypothetical protein ACFWNN_33715 [Lentzea sp. NPDC058450]|uniref:hypothetical protein n=1 Tax=Lentzea sp. NPDC058450 TaxID=3346505 RepID=UPI003669A39C
MRPVVVLLTAALLLGASAAPRQLAAADLHEIERLAQRYFERRADKVTNVPWQQCFGVPTTESFADRLRIDEAKLERRRERQKSLPHAGYSRAEVTTTLKRVQADPDGSVVIHLYERTDLHFEKSTTFDYSSYGMPHVLIFTPSAAGWVLAASTRAPGAKCGMPPETQFCGYLSER